MVILFFFNELALRVDSIHLIGINRVSQLLLSGSTIHSWQSEDNRWQVQRLVVLRIVAPWCHWLPHHQSVLWAIHWLAVNGIGTATHELILIIRNFSFTAHQLVFIFFWFLYQGFWRNNRNLDRSFKYFLDLQLYILRYQRIPILRGPQ